MSGPACRTSFVKAGSKAVATSNNTANRSREMAPNTVFRRHTNRKPSSMLPMETALWTIAGRLLCEAAPGRRVYSKTEGAQGRVGIGPSSGRPMIFTLARCNRKIVDAGDAQAHQAMFVEFPILVAVAPKPMPAIVMPLVGESHGDAIVRESPYLLDQPIVQFARPFSLQERLNGLAPLEELGAVPPAAVAGVSQRNARRVARVPRILGHAHLLRGSLQRERWQGWSVHKALAFDVMCSCPTF